VETWDSEFMTIGSHTCFSDSVLSQRQVRNLSTGVQWDEEPPVSVCLRDRCTESKTEFRAEVGDFEADRI
jgi:hypothetical protein